MKKLVRTIYAFKFLDDLVLIYPLYAVMFIEKGMQAWQVSALLLVWSITSFLLEVPSGVWADKYDRKTILLIGQIIRAAGYLCWLFFPGFTGFMIGFICWGTKSALSSGTLQAFVYDELKNYEQESQFSKIWGHAQTLTFLASLLASFLASPAILIGYPFVLILSAVAVLLSGIMIVSYQTKSSIVVKGQKAYFLVMKLGWKNALNNRSVFRLILLYALLIALNGSLDEYWPIFTKQVGVPVFGLGIALGLLSLGKAMGSYVAHFFEHKGIRLIYWLTILNGSLLFIASYYYQWPALVLLFFFSFIAAVIQVLMEAKIQHAIPDETRATVASINGFLTELFVMGVFIGFGFFSQWIDYQSGFLSFAGLIVLTGLLYLILNRIGQKRSFSDKKGQKRTAD